MAIEQSFQKSLLPSNRSLNSEILDNIAIEDGLKNFRKADTWNFMWIVCMTKVLTLFLRKVEFRYNLHQRQGTKLTKHGVSIWKKSSGQREHTQDH